MPTTSSESNPITSRILHNTGSGTFLNKAHSLYTCVYTVVSRKYAPPFATLALVQNVGGAYTRDATISLAITPSLPIKHDSLGGGGGGEAKHKASPNARRRDAPDASGRLMRYSIEGRESSALPRSTWHVHR